MPKAETVSEGCFWCSLKQIEECERQGVSVTLSLTYTPCTECQTKIDAGVMLMEAGIEPIVNGQPIIAPGAYPTGRWLVVDEKFLKANIGDNFDEYVQGGKMLLEISAFESIKNANDITPTIN